MPTRKQRRRQQKTRRHDYEYVYVDDDGREVEVDPSELGPTKPVKAAKSTATSGRGGVRSRGGRRTVEPPSWRRVGRRALYLGPLLIVAMLFLNRSLPLVQRIGPAILMLAFFLPFSYFTDTLAYRMYRKRVDRGGVKNRSG